MLRGVVGWGMCIRARGSAIASPDRLDGLVLVDAAGAPVERDGGGNLAFQLSAMPGVGNVMSQLLPRSLVERSLSQSVSNQAVVTPCTVHREWAVSYTHLTLPTTRAAV